jgi:Spy/CpxP family protein refolding chaperone
MKFHFLPLAFTLMASPILAQTAENSSNNPAPQEEGHHHGGWLFKKLNLTDAQRQLIKGIIQNSRPDGRATELKVLNAEKAVDSAIVQNPNDEANIRSLSATLESARTEKTIQHARVHAKILKVLTPEQQQQMAQMSQKRTEHLQERIDRLSGSQS